MNIPMPYFTEIEKSKQYQKQSREKAAMLKV
jgi:hypothetical protein